MSNGDGEQPAQGSAGEPAEQDEGTIASADVPTAEQLDELDRNMGVERKPMGPQDEETAVAEGEGTPSDAPPTEIA
jgi:hypothetical protein